MKKSRHIINQATKSIKQEKTSSGTLIPIDKNNDVETIIKPSPEGKDGYSRHHGSRGITKSTITSSKSVRRLIGAKQRALVKHLSEGCGIVEAMRKSGYSKSMVAHGSGGVMRGKGVIRAANEIGLELEKMGYGGAKIARKIAEGMEAVGYDRLGGEQVDYRGRLEYIKVAIDMQGYGELEERRKIAEERGWDLEMRKREEEIRAKELASGVGKGLLGDKTGSTVININLDPDVARKYIDAEEIS